MDPKHLAWPLNSFVGRRTETADVQRLLATARLVTLTGAGGVGKTRLAGRLAAVTAPHADRRWFADLGMAEPERESVLRVVAAEVGAPLQPRADPVDLLARRIGDGPGLLVLDNCEHLAEAAAVIAEGLLRRCAGLRILATSQRPLGVAGEIAYPLHGLPAAADAVTLFVDRAREADPGFASSPIVAEICRRLDGAPLAIELAAPWVALLTPAEILAELADHPLDLLADRRRSLRAVIDRSYRLLSPDDQRLLRRLAAFAGPYALDAALAAGADGPRQQTLAAVRRLVSASLLTATRGTPPKTSSFTMLSSVRAFAAERLAESGEQQAVRSRIVLWYVGLCAPVADPDMIMLPYDLVMRLDAERDNLAAAVDWARASGDRRALQLLGCALATAWIRLGWFERAAALAESIPEPDPSDTDDIRCMVWYVRAFAACDAGDLETADDCTARLARLAEQAGLRGYAVRAGLCRALIRVRTGRRAEMLDGLRDTIALATDYPDVTAWMRSTLAWYALIDGDSRRAGLLMEGTLPVLRDAGDPELLGSAIHTQAAIALAAADPRTADGLFREAVTYAAFDPWLLDACLTGLVLTAAAAGECLRALRLLGAREALPPIIRGQGIAEWARQLDRAEADCRRAVGDTAGTAAMKEGGLISRGELTAYAASDTWPRELPESPLTEREREIAQMVAEGLTNKQIAGRLTLSTRTVESHLEHIRTKLGFVSRSQISAWTVDQQNR